MAEAILAVFRLNEGINYGVVIPAILAYIFIFWLVISGWVYLDAKKRYSKKQIVILIAALNLIFGIPFFLMYLLFRPLEQDEVLGTMMENNGGLNVPLVNFVGKEGVVMSFQLKINSEKISPTDESEMKIDINFATNDQNKQMLPIASEVKTENVEIKTDSQVVAPKQNFFSRLSGDIKSRIAALRPAAKTAEAKPAVENIQQDKQVKKMVEQFINQKNKKKKK